MDRKELEQGGGGALVNAGLRQPQPGDGPAWRQQRSAPTAWQGALDGQAQQAKKQRRSDRGRPFDSAPRHDSRDRCRRLPANAGQESGARKVRVRCFGLRQGRRFVSTKFEATRLATIVVRSAGLVGSMMVGVLEVSVYRRDGLNEAGVCHPGKQCKYPSQQGHTRGAPQLLPGEMHRRHHLRFCITIQATRPTTTTTRTGTQ